MKSSLVMRVPLLIVAMKDDTELAKQFGDNPEFKRWLADTSFSMTYQSPRLARSPSLASSKGVTGYRGLRTSVVAL